MDLFENAETTLIDDKDPKSALQQYETIYKQFPEKDVGAKALYSMGWIYDHTLHQPEMAMIYYDSLVATFPETDQGMAIQKKLEFTQKEKERIAKVIADSLAMADSLSKIQQIVVMDTVSQAVPDTNSTNTIPVVPVVADSLYTPSEENSNSDASDQ